MTAQATKPKKNQARTKLQPDQRKKIAKLAIKGNTERAISALTGVPKTTIHAELQILKNSPEYMEFIDKKADCYEALQYKMIESVDQSAIKTMLSKRGLTDVGILEDKIRLIRGQSTANIAYNGRNITASIDQIRAELDKLKVEEGEEIKAESGTEENG